MAARHAFSWVPKVDLYPLCTVFAGAMAVVSYCSYRAIAHNPDVRLTAAQNDGFENGMTQARAEQYHNSIFRKAYQLRSRGKETVADVRIFQ